MVFDNDTYRSFFEGTKPINDSPTQTGDPAFGLAIGEACRIRQSYVDKLPAGRTFKIMWTRVGSHEYRWLDSEGTQGSVFDYNDDNDQLQFSDEHWEKV